MIFPALFALNTGLIISEIPEVKQIFLTPEMIEYGNFMTNILVLMPVLSITSITANILFTSIYFLIDSGIISTNRNVKEGEFETTDVHSVGEWFHDYLKGYSGISALITFLIFLVDLLSDRVSSNLFYEFGMLVMWPAMPLILTVMYIPLNIVLHRKFETRNDYIIKKAKNMGITEAVDIIVIKRGDRIESNLIRKNDEKK